MGKHISKILSSTQQREINLSTEEEIKVIIKYWARILNIKLGWIQDFDRLVVKYVSSFVFLFNVKYLFATFFMFEMFRSSSKLIKTFTKHIDIVWSIDSTTFDNYQFICSGSDDSTVCVWNVMTNDQSQSFNEHSNNVFCVKFSQYYYQNHRRRVICSSSADTTIRFWDFKHNQQFQIFNEHTGWVCGIEFSSFNGGRYLCSGSFDRTVRLWDVETSKSLHIFNGHENGVWCVDFSPLQNNNNDKKNNKSNSIGLIGGNGYTICSGSHDNTIRVWDIETAKQIIVFEGHKDWIKSVKYGSNELGTNGGANTILSGSADKSICLWDIRSAQQIQVFKGHTDCIWPVEYSPFVIDNIDVGGSSNVICSASDDDTIRFWDIRSNNNELYVIKGNDKRNVGIRSLKFLSLKNNAAYLCYGSIRGPVYVWGKSSS
ncbi:WD-40 repeat protein [Reticulomyxa filosa]|uniref:WD-40 repeat protein n=1 Tax=Reticulomyxa filosa TaxID=46433 RepID=X6N3X6_RETFI|nr:WD-40 repeat protein [Reticulomyxa filosa]|eukprot:ETO20751.1 WD-40 repeat protein [Reticulomyxa filosa]